MLCENKTKKGLQEARTCACISNRKSVLKDWLQEPSWPSLPLNQNFGTLVTHLSKITWQLNHQDNLKKGPGQTDGASQDHVKSVPKGLVQDGTQDMGKK